jgi:hypothetical protein
LDARPSPLDRLLPRRTFLGLCGATLLGVTAAGARAAQPAAGAPLGTAVGPSPERIAAALDYDVERIFRFVADEVRYDPYPGILRGATGTLWGRAGNAADQALLLAQLLRAAGRDVRFAVGRLDATTASAILTAAETDPDTTRLHAARAMAGDAAADGVTPPADSEMAAARAQVERVAEANQGAARAWLGQGIATVSDALAAAGITIATSETTLPALERDQHAWVQLANGTQWVDLDPTLPGAQQGATISARAESVLPDLPPEWRHRVIFRSMVETIAGDGLAASTVLEHEADAPSLVGLPITFMNARAEGVARMGVTVSGLLDGRVQYLPVLTLGGESVVGTPFAFVGSSGLFPDLGDGAAIDRTGETTAQWLEVSIVPPDALPSTARRSIFDRFGDDARAAGTLDPSVLPAPEMTLLGDGDMDEFLPARAIAVFAVSGGGINGEYYRQALREDGADPSIVTHTYHLAREALAADLGVDLGVRVFPDAPHVMSYRVVPTSVDADGELLVATSLDLWHRSLGLATVPGVTATGLPGVVGGVLTHVAERIALGEGLPADGSAGPVAALSVGAMFAAAADQGIGVRTLRGAGAADDLPYAPGALARVRAALASGLVVVAPERPVAIAGGTHVGWWLVDPSTGRTWDELEDGRGAESVEYDITNIPLTSEAKVIEAFKRYAACLAKHGATMGLFLSFEAGLADAGGMGTLASILAAAATAAKAANQLLNDPFFRALC